MIELNGKQYARVSDVLRSFSDFSHIDRAVLANKCEIGSNVHEGINDYINGHLPILSRLEMQYFHSFQHWEAALAPKFVESETRYFDDKLRLTGCIDALIKLPYEELPVLIDFKTSVSENPVTWPMQAHLYGLLLKNSGKEVAPRYLFIKLSKHGKSPTVYTYSYNENLMAKCHEAIEKFWENQNSVDSK